MEDFFAARQLRERLEEVRTVLVERPGSLSVETVGPALEEVTQGLMALQTALERSGGRISQEDQIEIGQLLTLSGRVGALYHQALALYSVER
jgi:hypothetical protein